LEKIEKSLYIADMSAWYVENGQDEIQNELRDRLDNLRSDLGLVGHGFIAFFCRRKFIKHKKNIGSGQIN